MQNRPDRLVEFAERSALPSCSRRPEGLHFMGRIIRTDEVHYSLHVLQLQGVTVLHRVRRLFELKQTVPIINWSQ